MGRLLGTNTTNDVYQAIRKLIVDRQLAPGSRINQNRLAERLSLSRTPVVKALHLLVAHDLVRHVPNAGFFVTDLSVQELYELFTLREALEAVIVRDLTPAITDDQLDELDSLAREFESAAAKNDEVAYQKSDEAFHSKLVEFSPNNLVARMIDEFEIHSRCFTAGLIRPPSETLAEHLALVEAMRSRDVERASQIIASHMAGTREPMGDLVARLRQIRVDPMTVRFKDMPDPLG